jgi:hypothetical protein
MFLKNVITIQLTMIVPLQFCACLKNAIMYARSRRWPNCRRIRGGVYSYRQDCPSHSISLTSLTCETHTSVFFNLPPLPFHRFPLSHLALAALPPSLPITGSLPHWTASGRRRPQCVGLPIISLHSGDGRRSRRPATGAGACSQRSPAAGGARSWDWSSPRPATGARARRSKLTGGRLPPSQSLPQSPRPGLRG